MQLTAGTVIAMAEGLSLAPSELIEVLQRIVEQTARLDA